MTLSLFFPQASRQWLWLLLSLFTLLALAYSLVLPLGEAADEAEHFALIRFLTEHRRPPLTVAEQSTISIKGDASPLYHTLVALLTQHVDVSLLPSLPDPRHNIRRAIPTDRLPFKGLYHTEDEYFPFRGIVLAWHLARLVSIPLGLITLLSLYGLVRRLFPHRPALALAAVSFAAFNPRFLTTSAIVNDDNLVLPFIGLTLYYLTRILQGDFRGRTFIQMGILAGLAAVTKYHALTLLPVIGVGLGWLVWRAPTARGHLIHNTRLALLAFALIAGSWFGFVLVQFNQIDQLGWTRGLLVALGDPVITSGAGRVLAGQPGAGLGYETPLGWGEWLTLLFRTFWFRLGRGHTIQSLPANLSLALLALLPAVGWLTRLPRPRQVKQQLSNPRGVILGLLLLHLLLYAGLVTARYLSLPTRETAQGRHLFPALPTLALLTVLGLSRLLHKLPHSDTLTATTLATGLGMFALLTPPLAVWPVYYPYLPITTRPAGQLPIQHRTSAEPVSGIRLLGYSLAPSDSDSLPLTLYWQAQEELSRNYLQRLCLHNSSGQTVICLQRHPADGRYPTRAWEPGFTLRDTVAVPLPACLPAGSYILQLTLLPLRLDTPTTQVDPHAPASSTLRLGQVNLTRAGPARNGAVLWLNGQPVHQPQAELSQLRQSIALVDLRSAGAGAPRPRFTTGKQAWLPLPGESRYTCPDGRTATVYSFILDAAIRPARYRPDTLPSLPALDVQTRSRRFTPPDDPPPTIQANFAGEVTLLGYQADLSPRRPGEVIPIRAVWQANRQMNYRYVGSFHLLDYQVRMQGQIDRVLGDDFEYPNVLWAPGEVVEQTFYLPVDADAPPGLYRLEFGVYTRLAGTFQFLPIYLPGVESPVERLYPGQIRVLDPAHGQPPAHLRQAVLGNQFELLGYDLSPEMLRPGDTLNLALYWQAITPPQTDYTVFTQLLGPDGQVWTQKDNPPQAGRLPTTAWPPHNPVVDRYRLTLPPNAPSGTYRLLVGMYRLSTGERLPAVDISGPLPDRAIPLTEVVVQ